MKQLISFSIMSIILCLATSSAKAPTQQKQRTKVTITLTENTWRVLFMALDKADVSHPTIRALQDSLYPQFNDTIKNPLK